VTVRYRKFWTRNRLGDAMRDRYNLNTLPFGVTDDTLDGELLPFISASDLPTEFD